MVVAYLSLGSNLGDREGNLNKAVEELAKHPKIKVAQVSSFIETAPVGCTDQPDFVNAAVRIETTLTPRELLAAVLNIEKSEGRVRTIRWGPRVIDIDILIYGDETIDEEDLKIPHPRMMERDFVLKPLAEIGFSPSEQ